MMHAEEIDGDLFPEDKVDEVNEFDEDTGEDRPAGDDEETDEADDPDAHDLNGL